MKKKLAKIWRILSLPTGFQLLIMRLFQDQFLIGITGVIFNDRDEVLLFKHTYRQNSWSLPGGYMKSKEHPFEALEREVKEESGLIISGDEQLSIRTDRSSSRLDVTVVGVFIGGEFKKSSEVSDYSFFAFDNLPAISKNQLLLIESVLHTRNLKKNKNVKAERVSIFKSLQQMLD